MFYLLPILLLLSACSVKDTGTPQVEYNLTFDDINLTKIIDANVTTTPPKVVKLELPKDINTTTSTTPPKVTKPKIELPNLQSAPKRPTASKVVIANSGEVKINTTIQPPISGVINGGVLREFTTLSTNVYGNGASSTGVYTMYTINVEDVEELTISVSTKPNASIRTIVSPYKFEQTNALLNNGVFGISYLVNPMSKPQTFLQRDPYAIVLKNDGIDTLYVYFAIDNDNTKSYFNAKSCRLALGIVKK